MCCLRYEHEFYVQSRKRFPKEGRLIKTKRGEEKVISNDIFRERVVLRGEDGEVRTILLTELREEAEAAGAPLPVVAAPQSRVSEELEAIDELRDEEDEEIVSGDVIVADEQAPDAVESVAASDDSPGDARERRPNRRRGRRGGRRNRPGGRGPRGPSDSTPPTQGGDS
jgi:hypothetical protein